MFRLACLAVLLMIATAALAGSPESSTRWAERLLAQTTSVSLPDHGYGVPQQMGLREAEQAFAGILRKYGEHNGGAWAGLARTQARLGKYDKAAASYRHALSLLTGNRALQAELGAVVEQQAAADSVARLLPGGEEVVQALPYPASRERSLWAVLSADVRWRPGESYWPDISNCHLTIFRGKPGAMRQVWRSSILGFPGHTNGEFNDIYLYAADITGDGSPELIVPKVYVGGSWCPSHIDVFTWRAGKLAHLLGAIADDLLLVKDLNCDGRCEVITDHAIGYGLCHAEQPRWRYVYAYKSETYQLAEGDFAGAYAHLYQHIRAKLREYPDDFELLYYYGRVCEIRRMPRTALKAYLRAEREGKLTLAETLKEQWTELEWEVSGALKEIDKRIARIR